MASTANFWRLGVDTDHAEFTFPVGIKKIYCQQSSNLAVKYADGQTLTIPAIAGIIELPNIGGYPNTISAKYQNSAIQLWIIETGPLSPGISKTIPRDWCTVTIPSNTKEGENIDDRR